MTQRTRYFLTGSALVLMVGLATGLVAYYNGNLPLGARSADLSEFTYLPADSTAVAFADVRAIMDSEFRQKLRQVLPTGEEKDKLQAETGIDLERDIDTVVASFSGNQATPSGALVLVRGRFNDVQVETVARQHGAAVEEYRGKRMLLMAHKAPEMGLDGNITAKASVGGLAFLEPGLLALGEADALKRAIDTNATKEDISKNAELMGLANDVRGGSNAWVVGRFDEMAASPMLPDQVKAHLPAVQLFAVSAHVNGGVNGMIRADARDDQAAEQLRDVVRGALAAGKLMAGQDAKIGTMLNSLQMAGTGRTVSLSFTVPAEVLDLLNGVAAMQNLGSGGGIRK